MTTLRQWLYGLALLGALAVLLYTHQQTVALERERAGRVADALATEQGKTTQQAAVIATLQQAATRERSAQTELRQTVNGLRTQAAIRQQQIKELTRENAELRAWRNQPLPDAVRLRRQRPTLTGADGYRDWLSGSRAVPAAGGEPDE